MKKPAKNIYKDMATTELVAWIGQVESTRQGLGELRGALMHLYFEKLVPKEKADPLIQAIEGGLQSTVPVYKGLLMEVHERSIKRFEKMATFRDSEILREKAIKEVPELLKDIRQLIQARDEMARQMPVDDQEPERHLKIAKSKADA